MTPARPALVFDFDGVLADTEPLIWKAWAELLGEYRIPFSWEDYLRVGRGHSDEEMLASLAASEADALLLGTLRSRIAERQERVGRASRERSPISPATIEMLHGLAGFPLGLVTSSERAEVEPLLRDAGISACFEALVFAEDCQRLKPDPEPYLRVRRKLNLEGGFAFEDSEAGLASCARAGFTPVRVGDPVLLPEVVKAIVRSIW